MPHACYDIDNTSNHKHWGLYKVLVLSCHVGIILGSQETKKSIMNRSSKLNPNKKEM